MKQQTRASNSEPMHQTADPCKSGDGQSLSQSFHHVIDWRFLASEDLKLFCGLEHKHFQSAGGFAALLTCLFEQQCVFRSINGVEDQRGRLQPAAFEWTFVDVWLHAHAGGVDQNVTRFAASVLPVDAATLEFSGQLSSSFGRAICNGNVSSGFLHRHHGSSSHPASSQNQNSSRSQVG